MHLIKTQGGSAGSPLACRNCGSKAFLRSQVAWHCADCKTYYPTELGFQAIKLQIEKLSALPKAFEPFKTDDIAKIEE